jgi:histidinol phosphatase-like PHP family hydrolase
VLDSDAHTPDNLMTREFAMSVALGSGMDQEEATALLDDAPLQLLKKVGIQRD